MAELSRYNVSDDEAGIANNVLKNKLGISDQQSLNDAETVLLADTYEHFFNLLEENRLHFTIELIFDIHGYFLEPLYEWAGDVRTIDISKDDMLFAPVKFLNITLEEFSVILQKQLPLLDESQKVVAKKVAIIHNEFNAVHPFREGNGRTIRLFLDLLVTSIGYQLIDYEVSSQEAYIDACRQGMSSNHLPMEKIMSEALSRNSV